MKPERNLSKRRRYFIKKDFQFRFIFKFCLLILLGVVISTGLLFLFSQDTLTSSFDQSRLVIKQTSFAILPAAIYTNVITLALITLATIAVTLFVSHKLAGPMFRFEEDIKVIGDGDLTKRVRLRKKDQLTAIVDSLNGMTTSLHEKLLTIHREVEQLTETASEQNAPQELIDGLKALHQKIETNFKL